MPCVNSLNSTDCIESITKCNNKKYISLTTLVATLAIGAAVVGILAIITSFQSISGLGAISQIGWQTGAALTVVGIPTLITLVIITLVRYCRSAEKNKEQYIDDNVETLPVQDNEEFNIEEPFSLKLDDIADFCFEKLLGVNKSLLKLEEKSGSIPSKALELGEPLTLGDLRSMNVEQMLAANIPENCFGLLSTAQLENIFKTSNNLTPEFVQLLLPENEYTYRRLRKLDYRSLEPHLKHMTISLFRYLPVECFELENFPWEIVTSNPENFKKLFSLVSLKISSYFDYFNNQFTHEIFKRIDIPAIKRLAPLLSSNYLRLVIPPEKLKDKDFPWSLFLKKEGTVSFLLSSDILASESFPWQKLSKSEILSILPIENENTAKILNDVIPEDVFKALVTSEKLDSEHLKLLSPARQKIIST